MQKYFSHLGTWILILSILVAAASSPAEDNVLISEFMASNATTLADEDNQYPDWVEIYNAGTNVVDLGGWALTDRASNLNKWVFPSTNMSPHSFMVVFVSGKNRRVPGANLHTSFSLDADGEYLALVKPDLTVASQLSPVFPKQYPDISYGLGYTIALVSNLTPARVLVPADDSLGQSWTSTSFDDTAWLAGTNGVGYQTVVPGFAVKNVKANVNLGDLNTALNALANPSQQSAVYLETAPFINYFNVATDGHYSNPPNRDFPGMPGATDRDDFVLEITGLVTIPTAGVWTFGVSSDDGFRLVVGTTTIEYPAARGTADTLGTVNFAAPGDYPLRLIYYERAGGAEAELFARQGSFTAWDSGFKLVGDTANGGLKVTSVPSAAGAGTGYGWAMHTDVKSLMLSNQVSAYVRLPFVVTNVGSVESLILRTSYDDGFVAYINGVEVARRNAPESPNWNTPAPAAHDGVPELVDLSSALPFLQDGLNVLAIHGMNVAPDDADFLVQAELLDFRMIGIPYGYLSPATPGGPNIAAFPEMVAPLLFSLPGGVYTNDWVTVELFCPTPGAEIRFTTNGATPTAASPLYVGPVSVTNSILLRARAFAQGYFPGWPQDHSYTLLDAGVLNFSSQLPLVVLDTYDQAISTDMNPKPSASITIIEVPQPSGRTTLASSPDVHQRILFEGRGQTSWGFNKKPFNIEFVNAQDNDSKVSFLGFPPGSDFVLLNIWNDKTFLNDFLAYELFEKMGHYSVRRRFVEVFYNGNYPGSVSGPAATPGKVGTNDYVGIGMLLEKIRVGKNRVDIADLTAEDQTEPDISGGYMFKKDKDSPGDVNFRTSSGQLLKFHQPPPAELSPAQRDWLINYINLFEGTLYSPNWLQATGTNHYSHYIDTDSFVDQHWIVEFTKQIDGYRLSSYFNKDRNGKIHWDPIWDWNLSFGNANYLQGGTTNGWYWTNELEGITLNEHIWNRRLITGSSSAFGTAGDPEFRQKITDRWGQLRQDTMNVSTLLARITQMTNYLWEAQARDFVRFPRLGSYLWPNPDGTGRNGTAAPAEGWHVNFSTTPTYSGIIGEMKKWVTGRYNWIESQFVQPPLFSRYSGNDSRTFSIFAPAGTVYYTLDGSDPRLPGGRISPNAKAYTAPFVLPANARVVARAYNPSSNYMTPFTAWSPPTRADFGYDSPRLAITEIMYHPPTPADTNLTSGDLEYIEITNPTANPIDLTAMRLAGGARFTFPTGTMPWEAATTTNDFDHPGTLYTASTLGPGTGASVIAGGPSANFLRLLSADAGSQRNRISFNQTSSGRSHKLVADFDFRVQNLTTPAALGPATIQSFDGAGANYVLANYDAADTNTPAVMGPELGSSGNYARLTRAIGGEVGGAFFDAAADRPYNVVMISFDFRIIPVGTPADGMGFVFMNTTDFGLTGAPTNTWNEEANATNSIGIGFDVYNNGAPADPNANHVSLHCANSLVATAVPTLALAAGVFHRAEITLNFQSSPALVSLKISPDVHGAGGQPELLFSDIPANIGSYIGRAGFIGRTGGSYASHDIDNLNIQYLDQLPSDPGNLSMVLVPTSTFGANGPGTTLATFTNVPAFSGGFALNLEVGGAVNKVCVYWDGIPRASAILPPVFDLANGVMHHARLELLEQPEGARASLALIPDVHAPGAAPVTILSNALVAAFCPEDDRVEFAASSGEQNIEIGLDNVDVAFQWPNWLAPGERLLLVKNRAAFESVYGTGLPIAGEFEGQLDNAGDHLALVGPYGEPILDFTYDDAWFPLTDGEGFSLVSADPRTPINLWSQPTTWQQGTQFGGSPGAVDPLPPTLLAVRVSEVLAHPSAGLDAIELYNPSLTQSADISGWFLTDDLDLPHKFRIPPATVIPPGCYMVLDELQFNANPGQSNSFALEAEGDQVWLLSADSSGELTGYYHGFDFGAADTDVTHGIYVTSDGQEHFVAQAWPTLGTNNSGPRVGPIVINEVMYHPPDFPNGVENTVHEFIELLNITSSVVLLQDPLHPNNTWKLRQAVDFQFPTNSLIPAHGYALVVSFDPAAEPDALASFRLRYGLDPGVAIFGPYSRKLSNSRDNIELAKPGAPGPVSGQPDYILVDKLEYWDGPPWPLAADGMGQSLQRIEATAYGNDPVNWRAGLPTPGRPGIAGTVPVITVQPLSQTLNVGANATFDVNAGPGPLTWQWRFNGKNLPGATNAVLLLSNVQLNQAGNYQVVVMNAAGATESSVANLNITQFAVLASPQSRVVFPFNNTVFSVGALGNGLTLRWQFNGVDIPGATNWVYSIDNVQPEHQGDYTVIASDGINSATTSPAHLGVTTHPIWLLEPTSRVVLPGPSPTNWTFTSEAFSSTPVSYQWRFNDVEIPGATSSSYTVTNVQIADGGVYTVIATDNYGSTNSTVVLTTAGPGITQQPLSQTVAAGSTLLLSINATGSIPLGFFWRTNNKVFAATFAPTLQLSNVQPSQAAAYSVVVSNAAGTRFSSDASVTIVDPPADQIVFLGSEVRLRAIVGQPRVSNVARWRFQGQTLLATTNVTFTGTRLFTNDLLLPAITADQAGTYTYEITNSTRASAVFIAQVQIGTAPPSLAEPQLMPDGSFRMIVQGTVGQDYRILVSSDLTNWIELGTLTATNVSTLYADPTATNAVKRFYRARSQ